MSPREGCPAKVGDVPTCDRHGAPTLRWQERRRIAAHLVGGALLTAGNRALGPAQTPVDPDTSTPEQTSRDGLPSGASAAATVERPGRPVPHEARLDAWAPPPRPYVRVLATDRNQTPRWSWRRAVGHPPLTSSHVHSSWWRKASSRARRSMSSEASSSRSVPRKSAMAARPASRVASSPLVRCSWWSSMSS